jgi:hypothetical protein
MSQVCREVLAPCDPERTVVQAAGEEGEAGEGRVGDRYWQMSEQMIEENITR